MLWRRGARAHPASAHCFAWILWTPVLSRCLGRHLCHRPTCAWRGSPRLQHDYRNQSVAGATLVGAVTGIVVARHGPQPFALFTFGDTSTHRAAPPVDGDVDVPIG